MKHILLLILLVPAVLLGQICDPAGNVIIFSNYDGGNLTIDVDVDIPNLKIGVVSYEGANITLTGTYVSNVTAVEYAGYNGSNTPCGGVINTSINGAPGGATTNIVILPASTLSNPNGYSSIVCAYSCDNGTNQGGCNTVDQVEDYFLTLFGGTLYSHHTQYGCWSGTSAVSDGGNCCPLVPVSASATTNDPTCFGFSDGSIVVTALGGVAPYTYTWTPNVSTSNIANTLPAGNYQVIVEDNNGDTDTLNITLADPADITAVFTSTPDPGDCTGSITVTASGGTPPYDYIWDAAGGGGTSPTATDLCAGYPCVTINDSVGCVTALCDTIISTAGIADESLNIQAGVYPNPSAGRFTLSIQSAIQQDATVYVYNAQGIMVRKTNVQLINGNNTFQLTIESAGVYMLSIQTEEDELIQQLLVE